MKNSKKKKKLCAETKVEPNQAGELEREGSSDMTTSFLKTEPETTSSSRDSKGARKAQTFRWSAEFKNCDDFGTPQQ